MKVTLDTNILVQDYWLQNFSSKLFLDGLKHASITLYIPEIVIDEIVNKFKEQLTEKYNNYLKNEKELNKILRKENNTLLSINIDKETKEYKTYLMNKLKSIKCSILPYPDIAHQKIVNRIFEKRKPFHTGEKGYRDFLIWETIKELASSSNEIVFITNNANDFGNGPYISEQYGDETVSHENFRIFNSIADFNEKYIMPAFPILEKLKLELEHNKFIFNWVNTNLLKLLQNRDIRI